MRVVVTSAYSNSLHAVALIHGLADQGHDVALCLRVRMLALSRLRFYVRQLGWRGFRAKIKAKLFFGNTKIAGTAGEAAPMLAYLNKHNIKSRNVGQACRQVGARHVVVKLLNTPAALTTLRDAQPDLVVYAGGGLLRQAFLDTPPLGVINAHGGSLPLFRGMNALEWSLFYGVKPRVAVHYIDLGLDSGPVIAERLIPLEAWSEFPGGRGVATTINVQLLLDTVPEIVAGHAKATPQDPQAARSFFVMADPLLEVVRRWIDDDRTPTIDADTFRFSDGPIPTLKTP